MEKLINPNYDYDYGQLVKINKITQEFWKKLIPITEIFKEQIINIKDNINNFNYLLKKQSKEFNQDKMLKSSQKIFSEQTNKDNIKWGNYYPMKPLHQNDWLNIHNTTKYNRSFRNHKSEKWGLKNN